MIINKNIFVLIGILCSLFYGKAQDSYTQMYDLEFRFDKNNFGQYWRGYCVGNVDSSIIYNGKHPIKIVQESYLNVRAYLNGKLKQYIWLPDIRTQDASIALTYKSQNIKSLTLNIAKFDRNEQFVSEDIFILNKDSDNWQTYTGKLLVDSIKSISICIEAKGLDSMCEQNLWLDRVKIKLDNKDIDSFPLPINYAAAIDSNRVIPLAFTDTTLYRNIDGYMKTKRIIALGETVHGCEEMNLAPFQIIKEQIVYNNCNLVLMELPLETMMSFNFFVQGNSDFNIDSLINSVFPITEISAKQFRKFCIWLRDYNKTTEKKVYFLGMDTSIDIFGGIVSLCDILYNLNKTKKSSVIDSFYVNIHRSYKEFHFPKPQLLEYIDDHSSEITPVLGDINLAIIRQCINSMNVLDNMSQSLPYPKVLMRDTLMYENTIFLEKLLSPEKIIVYAHLGHVDYISNDFIYTYGSYMRNKWGKEYGCVGILASSGSFLTTDILSQKAAVKKMNIPVYGSLEQKLSDVKSDYYFYQLPEHDKSVCYIREMGNSYMQKQFKIIVPSNCMDAVLFIRRVSPVINNFTKGLNSMERWLIHLNYVKNLKEKVLLN